VISRRRVMDGKTLPVDDELVGVIENTLPCLKLNVAIRWTTRDQVGLPTPETTSQP
jgi:hypothetical protein